MTAISASPTTESIPSSPAEDSPNSRVYLGVDGSVTNVVSALISGFDSADVTMGVGACVEVSRYAAAVTIVAGMTTRRSAFMTDSNTATRSVPLQYPSKTASNVSNGPRTTFTGVPIESLGGFERSAGPSAHLEINSSITQIGTVAACPPNCTMLRTPGVYRIRLAACPKLKYAKR